MHFRIPAAIAIAVSAALSTSMVADAAPRSHQITPDTTTTIGDGATLDALGDVSRADRVDHHLLIVDGTADITVEVTPLGMSQRAPNWSLRILDADGRRVASERGKGGSLLTTSIPAGSYLVDVRGRSGGYRLTASAVLTDVPVNVAPVPVVNDPPPPVDAEN